ncbi:SDR family NAD(P)-dependent oxidoreductase [uncultured Marinobacter sp.]|uniref:SDR family NAD(P)-dependent oxidoreductase n=1 Tax=uncultured Marinobacter sp. TaxID=187379 RepID=UPI0030DC8BF8
MADAPVAVVTGAGRRLGYEIARALLQRGFRVYALYRSETDEIRELEQQGAHILVVDLANPHEIQNALDRIAGECPDIALLVNNASEFTPDTSDTPALATQAARLFQINSIAPLMLMSGLSEHLTRAGENSGRPSLVVNITDIFVEKPNPRFAAYCASKAALSNLTLSYARQLAPQVRVNAIMPGPIRFLPSHTDEQKARVMAETLLPREGGFDSVVIQLLALLDNDFMTGALIPVDGGRRLA